MTFFGRPARRAVVMVGALFLLPAANVFAAPAAGAPATAPAPSATTSSPTSPSALSAIASPVANPPVTSCSILCDETCQTCCPHWQIHATCGTGERAEGDFTSYAKAVDAASHATTSECGAWQPACIGPGLKPDDEKAAAQSVADSVKSLDAAEAALTASNAALVAFTQDHVLTRAGEHAVPTTAEMVRAADHGLTKAETDLDVLRVRGAGLGPEITAAQANAEKAIRDARDAIAAVDALTKDPLAVNAAADEKNRRAREAAAALVAKLAELEHTAATMMQKTTASQTELTEILARPALGQTAHKAGDSLQRDLTKESTAWSALGESEAASHENGKVARASSVADFASRSQALEKRTTATAAAITAFGANPPTDAPKPDAHKSTSTPAIPAPPPPTPTKPEVAPVAVVPVASVPVIATCTVSLTVTGGGSHLQATVDGGRPVSLPADVKVASGRHSIVVKSGAVASKSSELVLCDRTKTVTVEAPR